LKEITSSNAGTGRKWIKVGHGGTLDPFATGVLVIAVGSACSQLQSFLQGSKVYKATVKFGEETDTMDLTGQVIATQPVPPHITLDAIRSVLSRYTGVIEQVPPAYSAVHVGGKRAYELARKGIAVELTKRKVRIDRIECTRCSLPIAEFCIECSGGTYIRRLLSDVAKDLQTVGHLIALERTKQGPFHVQEAIPWEAFTHLQVVERAMEQFRTKCNHQQP
jgi:tRNA pseudouridine55 synthase